MSIISCREIEEGQFCAHKMAKVIKPFFWGKFKLVSYFILEKFEDVQ